MLRDEVTSPERFARLTDSELLSLLAEHEPTADFETRLRERSLYKRAIWAQRGAVPDRFVGLAYDRTRELEREIAELAGVDPSAVIVDSPPVPSSPESRAKIVVNGELRRLEERSSLVAGLDACAREIWRLGVYAPEPALSAVRDAAAAVLETEATVAP